jgi:hypothetical protein
LNGGESEKYGPGGIAIQTSTLFSKNFLHLADLLFDFPAYVIALALAFQVQGHSRRSLMDQPFSNSVLK